MQVSITVSFVLKRIGSLACIIGDSPKPKYEPFITHNRDTLINQYSYKSNADPITFKKETWSLIHQSGTKTAKGAECMSDCDV